MPADSRYMSKDWRVRLSSDYNNHGELLTHQLRVSRESRLRNGSYEYGQININSAGVDDLLTRGNGVVNLPPNMDAYFEYERPRRGNWAYNLEFETFTGGLAGNDKVAYTFEVEPTYFLSDKLNVFIGAEVGRTPDWLVWQQDNLIGSFDKRETSLNAGFNWTLTNRQELRLRLQAIALNAQVRQAYRVDDRGNAIASDDPVADFSVRNLALQIRYRYELAPLSYLYVVYGRGGYDEEEYADSSGRLMRDSFNLRDDEQLLVKISYRFES